MMFHTSSFKESTSLLGKECLSQWRRSRMAVCTANVSSTSPIDASLFRIVRTV
jgi:hypothetical protein